MSRLRSVNFGDEIRSVAEGQATLRQEVQTEFAETRSMIRLSYGELERRVGDLEAGRGRAS